MGIGLLCLRAGRLWMFLLPVLALVALWNVAELGRLFLWWLDGAPRTDWSSFARLTTANPYEAVTSFRWAPPAAWLWVDLIEPMGVTAWRLLHLVVLLLVPFPIAALVLVSAPFWADVINGNILTFAFVAAWRAVRGDRMSIVAFIALAVLVPRPLMLPVLGWLLWRDPLARRAALLAALAVLGGALLSGQLLPWLSRLLETSGPEIASTWNIGPSHFVGLAWIPIGFVLAALLTWRGHLGLASLAASPYLIHYYLLFGLLELRRPSLPRGDLRDPEVQDRECSDERGRMPSVSHPPA